MRVGRRAGGGGDGRSRTIKSPRQALLVFLASDIGVLIGVRIISPMSVFKGCPDPQAEPLKLTH